MQGDKPTITSTRSHAHKEKGKRMSSEQKHSDRRRHARFELLEYAMVYSEEGQEPAPSVMVDISLGGMQTRSRRTLDAGTPCEVVIGRGTEKPLVVHADVTYSRRVDDSGLFAVGFRFKPKTTAERVELVDYVHAVFQTQGETLII